MDTKEFIIYILLLFVILVGFLFSVVGAASLFERARCEELTQLYADQIEVQWRFWTGCMVKTPSGYWIDADSVGLIEGILNADSP